ncbi:MAG: pyrroloquinoline quinone biosynthesis protein PqqE, partial [Alphaproteobacteria bacterium]
MPDDLAITDPTFDPSAPPLPTAMLAELTHRCPLKCPYCSNPTEMIKRSGELSTDEWIDVFTQAARLGILHVHLSGGEPAARSGLPALVKGAAEAGLYTNLITSGVSLRESVFAECVANRLDHVQLSIQGSNAATADRVGGFKGGFDTKMRVAEWVATEGLPLTVNAVMHRQNLDQLTEVIALAERLGARRLEVAHTQYHGWAYVNRAALLPTQEQVHSARHVVEAAVERLQGRMVIDYVVPDHFATFPKPCLGGWGRTGINIAPDGKALPCHADESIPSLQFD